MGSKALRASTQSVRGTTETKAAPSRWDPCEKKCTFLCITLGEKQVFIATKNILEAKYTETRAAPADGTLVKKIVKFLSIA